MDKARSFREWLGMTCEPEASVVVVAVVVPRRKMTSPMQERPNRFTNMVVG